MKNYLPLKTKSNKLSDEYYRCLSEWLARRTQTPETCMRVARQYRTALRKQLKDLARLSDHAFVQREREMISTYLDLVDKDLENLHRGDDSQFHKRQPPRADQ